MGVGEMLRMVTLVHSLPHSLDSAPGVVASGHKLRIEKSNSKTSKFESPLHITSFLLTCSVHPRVVLASNMIGC